MFRISPWSVLALVVVIGSSVPAVGQEESLDQYFGLGSHSYFAGKYEKAHEYLTQAIKEGSEDPRCYYFRALSYLKLGRQAEAEKDMAAGGKLEMAPAKRYYDVNRSLTRVQGKDRLLLEKYRKEARLAAHAAVRQAYHERYERIRKMEAQVLLKEPEKKDGVVPASAEEKAEEKPAEEKPAEEKDSNA